MMNYKKLIGYRIDTGVINTIEIAHQLDAQYFINRIKDRHGDDVTSRLYLNNNTFTFDNNGGVSLENFLIDYKSKVKSLFMEIIVYLLNEGIPFRTTSSGLHKVFFNTTKYSLPESFQERLKELDFCMVRSE